MTCKSIGNISCKSIALVKEELTSDPLPPGSVRHFARSVHSPHLISLHISYYLYFHTFLKSYRVTTRTRAACVTVGHHVLLSSLPPKEYYLMTTQVD